MKYVVVAIATVCFVLLFPSKTQSVITPPETPKEEVKLAPELVKVCTCESGQGTGKPQHFDVKTGNVLHGKINPKDIGMCQINEKWNGEKATRLGWDIYTLEGNIKMANYLYKTQGLAPSGDGEIGVEETGVCHEAKQIGPKTPDEREAGRANRPYERPHSPSAVRIHEARVRVDTSGHPPPHSQLGRSGRPIPETEQLEGVSIIEGKTTVPRSYSDLAARLSNVRNLHQARVSR